MGSEAGVLKIQDCRVSVEASLVHRRSWRRDVGERRGEKEKKRREKMRKGGKWNQNLCVLRLRWGSTLTATLSVDPDWGGCCRSGYPGFIYMEVQMESLRIEVLWTQCIEDQGRAEAQSWQCPLSRTGQDVKKNKK